MDIESGTEVETVARPQVAAFPLDRRVGEVRRAARMLASLDDVDACDAFRHALAERMFADLEAIGLTEDAQDEAVGAFFHAVECALEDVFAAALEQYSLGLH